MARGKKTEKLLTPEEKLQQAMVPVSEQPYKVPQNWCWLYGWSFLKPMETKKPTGVFFRYIDIDSIDNKRQIVYEPKLLETKKAPSRASRALHVGDTVFSMVRPYLKNIAYIDDSLADSIASTGFYICSPQKSVNPRFFYYLMISNYVVEGLNTYMKGDNSPSIRKNDLEQFQYPIPPLLEQQRIVDRIESLFAKLDEAKEKAQAVVDGFEDRKAAILHKALTGELTEQWRKTKGIPFVTWKRLTVKDVCEEVKVGIVIKPSQYYTDKDNGVAAFRSANVREFHIDDFDWVYLNDIGMSTNQRSVVHTGDVLVVRSGNPGTACVVEERFNGYNAIDILIAVPNKEIITPDYLCAFINSPIGRNLVANNKRGMALAHFNVGGYSKLELPLPSIEEQRVIISIVYAFFEKEQQAKESAERVITQIDTMKKSILARAFHGELGTNDPSDESAEELLKRIL